MSIRSNALLVRRMLIGDEPVKLVEGLDEIERIRLWWYWMIEHYTENAWLHPAIWNRRKVSFTEFYAVAPMGDCYGRRWALAHYVVERYVWAQPWRNEFLCAQS
jgi:hypothetical protein